MLQRTIEAALIEHGQYGESGEEAQQPQSHRVLKFLECLSAGSSPRADIHTKQGLPSGY